MKNLLNITSLAFAAILSFHSAQWFDQLMVNGKALNVTGRVIDGSIQDDVARVQSETVEGKRILPMAQYEGNMASLEQHCQVARRAHGLSAAECFGRKGTVRSFPTITNGF